MASTAGAIRAIAFFIERSLRSASTFSASRGTPRASAVHVFQDLARGSANRLARSTPRIALERRRGEARHFEGVRLT
jgi:hypothetical protein